MAARYTHPTTKRRTTLETRLDVENRPTRWRSSDKVIEPTDRGVLDLVVVIGDHRLRRREDGPHAARMVRRAFDELGRSHRTVWAVSRFSNPSVPTSLLCTASASSPAIYSIGPLCRRYQTLTW